MGRFLWEYSKATSTTLMIMTSFWYLTGVEFCAMLYTLSHLHPQTCILPMGRPRLRWFIDLSKYQDWKVAEPALKYSPSNSDSKVVSVWPHDQLTFSLSPNHTQNLKQKPGILITHNAPPVCFQPSATQKPWPLSCKHKIILT